MSKNGYSCTDGPPVGRGGQTRELVLTGIWWTICEKLGRWNTDTVAELKINEGGTDLDLPGEMYELYTTVWKMSMKSIIAHSVARGAR
jgi:hypothetical protein